MQWPSVFSWLFAFSIKKNGFGGTMSLIGSAERAAKGDAPTVTDDVIVHAVKWTNSLPLFLPSVI